MISCATRARSVYHYHLQQPRTITSEAPAISLLRRRSATGAFGNARAGSLELNAQSVGDAIDEGEVAHNRAGIVYRAVIESRFTQCFNVGKRHRCRIEGQLVGVSEQRCFAVIEPGEIETRMLQRGNHSLNGLRIPLPSPNPTETRSVMSQSIPASVERRHPHAEQLTLPARKRTGPMHEFPVQRVVLVHDGRMHAMDLNDVVGIRNPLRIRQLVLGQVADERHGSDIRLPRLSGKLRIHYRLRLVSARRATPAYEGIKMRSVAALFVLHFSVAAALTAQSASSLSVPTSAEQVKLAVLAAPQAFRSAATVLGYGEDRRLRTLRAGSNDIICLADDPGEAKFHSSCYHKSLEPFMAAGRAIRTRYGKEAPKTLVDSLRLRDIRRGRIKMPAQPAALYQIFAESDSVNVAAGTLKGSSALDVIYVPYGTTATTGFTTDALRGTPWLMYPGKPWAHVMIVH